MLLEKLYRLFFFFFQEVIPHCCWIARTDYVTMEVMQQISGIIGATRKHARTDSTTLLMNPKTFYCSRSLNIKIDHKTIVHCFITFTCCLVLPMTSLVTHRPPMAPRPLTIMASAFRASRQPPLSQNPAYAPGYRSEYFLGISPNY